MSCTATRAVTVNVIGEGEPAVLEQTVNGAPAFAYGSYAFDLSENATGRCSASPSHGLGDGPRRRSGDLQHRGGRPRRSVHRRFRDRRCVYIGAGEDYASGPGRYELTVRASDGVLHSDAAVTSRDRRR